MRMKTDHKGIVKIRLPLKFRTPTHDGSKTDAIGPSVETNLRMHMTTDHDGSKTVCNGPSVETVETLLRQMKRIRYNCYCKHCICMI